MFMLLVVGMIYFVWRNDIDHMEVVRMVHNNVHPLTDKSEDMHEISQRLTEILSSMILGSKDDFAKYAY